MKKLMDLICAILALLASATLSDGLHLDISVSDFHFVQWEKLVSRNLTMPQTLPFGDALVISNIGFGHKIVQLSWNDFKECHTGSPVATFHEPVIIIPLVQPGTLCFASDHTPMCMTGFKMCISVAPAPSPKIEAQASNSSAECLVSKKQLDESMADLFSSFKKDLLEEFKKLIDKPPIPDWAANFIGSIKGFTIVSGAVIIALAVWYHPAYKFIETKWNCLVNFFKERANMEDAKKERVLRSFAFVYERAKSIFVLCGALLLGAGVYFGDVTKIVLLNNFHTALLEIINFPKPKDKPNAEAKPAADKPDHPEDKPDPEATASDPTADRSNPNGTTHRGECEIDMEVADCMDNDCATLPLSYHSTNEGQTSHAPKSEIELVAANSKNSEAKRAEPKKGAYMPSCITACIPTWKGAGSKPSSSGL